MKIKETPEDFIVEEIIDLADLKTTEKKNFTVYRLWKCNLNTEEAIEIICQRNHLLRKNIKYAGTKDKNAQTTQYISIFKDNGKISTDGKDLKLTFIGFSDEPLSLGTLKGNSFKIKIKELTEEEKEKFRSRIDSFVSCPNYFDEQRFSKNNFQIGLAILKKDYGKAISHILESSGEYESKVASYLEDNPKDYIGALKNIPKKILSMYLHSVQSKIFNDSLSELLKEYATNKNIASHDINYSFGKLTFLENPEEYKNLTTKSFHLVGFDSVLEGIQKEILKKIEITPRDFIIRSMPEFSMETSDRECVMKIENMTYEFDSVDSDPSDSVNISFYIGKGSYATIVLKALLS